MDIQKLSVDQLINYMEMKLIEIRDNLLIAKLSDEQVLPYFNMLKDFDFTKLSPSDDEIEKLEDIRRQYLILFKLYIH